MRGLPLALLIAGNLGYAHGLSGIRDMNQNGQMVGVKNLGPADDPSPLAFRWTPGATEIETLPPLPGDKNSQAPAINAWRRTVGSSFIATSPASPLHALLWPATSAAPIALPPLEPGGQCAAVNINDFAMIAGVCWAPSTIGPKRAVVWTPHIALTLEVRHE